MTLSNTRVNKILQADKKQELLCKGLNWPPPAKGDTKHIPKMQGTIWLLYTHA